MKTSVIVLGLAVAACERTPSPGTGASSAAPTASAPATAPASSSSCTKDADCVPAECCHARTCSTVKPKCEGIACTMSVEPGTLDVGRCVCRAGKCAADIPPIPPDQLPR